MGNKSTRSSLRNAIIHLNISADQISANDDKFWNQILAEDPDVAQDVMKTISTQEIRMLRDGSPRNFSLLAYKMVECLNLSTKTLCNTQSQQAAVLNSIRILTKIIPCIFEDRTWQDFFEINQLQQQRQEEKEEGEEGEETGASKSAKREVKLMFPEKNADERNYVAYLPNMSSSSRAISIGLQGKSSDDEEMMAEGSSSRAQAETVSEKRRTADLLISEEFLIDEMSSNLNIEHARPFDSARGNAAKGPNLDKVSLMRTLIISVCDLLFCPEFTVLPHGESYLSNTVDAPPESLKSLSTYDYVWEPGVGFDSSINSTTNYDKNRSELLRILTVCLSNVLYERPEKSRSRRNNWMEVFISNENRLALPLFTSMLNVIFVYKQSRPILSQLTATNLRDGDRDTLVVLAIHLLLATLDYNIGEPDIETDDDGQGNLFIEYLSRIHRDEDYAFMVRGFTRLLNDKLAQRYIWAPSKPVELDLELMLLFWKVCNCNRKFLLHLLKSQETLDIVVPMLYHLNENFQDPSRTALIHLGVFNLSILSGERNFSIKLNKRYTNNCLTNLPEFKGSHADLMILVFHKLIMYGYKINQLYDYLLNILVNISPYLKGLTLLASKCLIQLFETFSSTYVIFTEPNYHQLVAFLLEIFNNIVQYQFDSNANLIYIIINKRHLFVKLANLSTSQKSIDKVLKKLIKRKMRLRQLESSATLEQQHSQISGEQDEMNENDFGKEIGQAENFFDFDLATVSCTTCPQNSRDTSRQEVSLVATPDIHHFTHPTHPFLPDCKAKEVEIGDTNSLQSLDKKQEPAMPSINFDDILDQSSNYETIQMSNGDESIDGNSLKDFNTKEPIGLANPKEDSSTNDDNNDSTCSNENNVEKVVEPTSNKWRPSSRWLIEWKRSLPLQTVLRMIAALVPQLEQAKHTGARMEESEVIKFLQNGTLVGLLPVPHPILIRKYRTNNDSNIWLRACTWAIIYVKSTAWTNTDVRLIRIL